MTNKQGRKSYTLEFKAKIIKKHLKDGQQVSEICDEYKLAPSLFYKWLPFKLRSAINKHNNLIPKSHWLSGQPRLNLL